MAKKAYIVTIKITHDDNPAFTRPEDWDWEEIIRKGGNWSIVPEMPRISVIREWRICE